MLLYFYVHDADFFGRTAASLVESHRARDFGPCQELCRTLLDRKPAADALIHAILSGLPFDRHLWRGLVGEYLIYGANDIPRLPLDPVSLCLLLGAGLIEETARADYAPIQQALFGTRDMRFGAALYRPNHAGLNDSSDVIRLSSYLSRVDMGNWSADALRGAPDLADDEARAEELAFARDGWPAFIEMYVAAVTHQHVIVCEVG